MAEVVGQVSAFWDGDVRFTFYFDDVTTEPTRIISEAQPGYAVTVTVSNLVRTTTFTRNIPTGTTEYSIPRNVARKLSFGGDLPEGDPGEPTPGDIDITFVVSKVI